MQNANNFSIIFHDIEGKNLQKSRTSLFSKKYNFSNNETISVMSSYFLLLCYHPLILTLDSVNKRLENTC